MVTTKPLNENFVPYAPYSAVIEVVRRYRDRGLPDPVTAQALEQVGVSPTMTGVVAKALVFLRLIDEAGNKTEALERLRKASSEEYRPVLAEIVRNAYVTMFTIVDPAQDSKVAVDDAFRRCEPANQRAKMVRLFLGLCEEAGIVGKKPRMPILPDHARVRRERDKDAPVEPAAPAADKKTDVTGRADMAPNQRLLSAIFQQLPSSGKWTTAKRKRWLDAMTSAIDLIVEVQDSDDPVI